MRATLSIAFAAALASGLGTAQAGALKPGLWEVHPISHVVDGKDVAAMMKAAQEKMAAALSKLPPDQRAKMGVGMGGTVCITPEMADEGMTQGAKDQGCEKPKVSRSGDKVSFEFKCVHGDRTTVGKGENSLSGDVVHSQFEMTMTDPNGTKVTKAETELKWLKADCGDAKPKP